MCIIVSSLLHAGDWGAGRGGSGLQGHLQLHKEFEASVRHKKIYQRMKERREGEREKERERGNEGEIKGPRGKEGGLCT